MKKKNNAIQTPDMPEDLEPLIINEMTHQSAYEMGRVETSIGPVQAEHVRFNEIHMKGVIFAETHLPFSSWTDVLFEECDLSHVTFNRAQFNRVTFRDCKLAGTNFDESMMRDVQWSGCQAPYSLFNLTELQDVRFDDCFLKGANFFEANVDNIQLGASMIEDVQFTGTSLENVDLSRCPFTHIHASEQDLRGAVISSEQALSFIELFGLKVKREP